MAYLIEMMQDKDYGKMLTTYVISLLELVLHEKNGLYCPNCGKEKGVLTYDKIHNDIGLLTKEEQERYLRENIYCKNCGGLMREVYSIKDTGKTKKLCIYNNELSSQDFEELKTIIAHYNILNYDGDKYIDPDLKADLEKKRKLENRDYTSPTLEKQIVCVCISTNYKLEEIKQLSMRKLTYLLKLIDAKENYYC